MTGIVNSTGAKSGIIGTTVGTPPVTDLATATFPAGHIVKVDSITYTGAAQIAVSFNYTTAGNLTITTDTPASSSSKFLLMADITHSISDGGALTLRFYDSTTAIAGALSDASGVITRGSFGPGHWSTGPSTYPTNVSSMNYLYSPGSATALTLSIKGTMNNTTAWYYNRAVSSSDATWLTRSISTFTVMEIAG